MGGLPTHASKVGVHTQDNEPTHDFGTAEFLFMKLTALLRKAGAIGPRPARTCKVREKSCLDIMEVMDGTVQMKKARSSHIIL